MNRLRQFLRLPQIERRALVDATLLVVAIRLGLWLLPFRTLRRVLARLARTRSPRRLRERLASDRIVWATTVASRYVPAGGPVSSRP